MEAELQKLAGKACFRRGDAKVRYQGEAEPTGGSPAPGSRRCWALERNRWSPLVEMLAAFGRAGLRAAWRIGAGAERLALGAEHVGADVAVAVERLEGVGDLVDQRIVEEIARRPLDFDDADMTFAADADILEGGASTFPPSGQWSERRYCPAAGAPVGAPVELGRSKNVASERHAPGISSWAVARWVWE